MPTEPDDVLSTSDPIHEKPVPVGLARVSVTGTITTYFESPELYEAVLAGERRMRMSDPDFWAWMDSLGKPCQITPR